MNLKELKKRFWKNVDKSGDCWTWQAAKSQGYGMFWPTHSKGVYAHRLSYEWLVGKIPKGLVIDHLCNNPSCVNPAHLSVVSHRENILRGSGTAAINHRKTHCKNGHPFTKDNTKLRSRKDRKTPKRVCITCNRKREKERYEKQKHSKEWLEGYRLGKKESDVSAGFYGAAEHLKGFKMGLLRAADFVGENHKGSFEDDYGHICWYADELKELLLKEANKDL